MNLKSSSLMLVLVGSISAQAQMSSTLVNGNVTQNGTAFTGGDMSIGDNFRLVADSSNPLSELAFGPRDNTGQFFPNRYMMKFAAEVMGASVFLPTDRFGATSLAADGESRIFSTWDTHLFTQMPTNHSFSTRVEASGGATGAVDIDIQSAPEVTRQVSGGAYTVDRLDNSIYDIDPTVGGITVNKLLTPTITLNYVLPEITFTRGNAEWDDATETASAFRDDSSTSMWFLLGNQIFSDEFSPGQTFSAGEGPASKIVGQYSGSITMDWSDIANGTYTGQSWAIGWNTFGYDNDQGGLSIGGVEQRFDDAAINVVPEPATFAALGVGLLALRRRRKTS